MAVNITEFSNKASIVAPSVPNFIAEDVAISVMQDFCKRSECWRYEHDDIIAIPSINLYNFDPPDGTRVCRIISANNASGASIAIKSLGWMDANVATWKTNTGDYIDYITESTRDDFYISPMPTLVTTNAISDILLALMPTVTATTVDDFLYNDHRDTIINGIKGKLLLMPAVSWANPSAGAAYLNMYDDGVKSATSQYTSQGETGKKFSFLHPY